MTDQEKQELNELVAKKLGWIDIRWIDSIPNQLPSGWYGRKSLEDPIAGLIPNYVGDIKACWEIVKYLTKERNLQTVLNIDQWGCNACSIYAMKEYQCLAQEEAGTITEAIVKAFLKLP